MKHHHRTALRAGAIAGASLIALAGCSAGSQDPDAAAEEGGTLTVWAWEPTLEAVVEAYEAENEGVDIELVNAGTGNDQYTALQNAIQAGSGIPDIAQIEYFAVPQFAIADSLADISDLGAAELDGTFAPGPWSAVSQGDAIVGMPMDSGPMAMFYNAEVFERLGVAVPTTWDEYLQAARDLRAADPSVSITNDTGDAGLATSLMWQSGAEPFTVDGTTVGIDLEGDATRYAEIWQPLIDEQLFAPVTSWSDEWFAGMNDGTIASITTGAWMPANLESGAPDTAGDWRVAPMPQWEADGAASAENGGSSLAVTAASEQAALAYDFLEYATTGDGVQIRLDAGAFPATTAELESQEFLDVEFEYFGGQQANQVFAESSANVVDGWSYLPYQVYANSIFNDTVGQAYVGDTTIVDGLAAWQEQIDAYGEEQGFTIE